MLPRFVALSEERLPAARPVPRRSLTAAEQEMAEKLQDQRLLVGAGDTVRLAHERLITAWPRLAQALSDRRDDLLLQARLERQAADWQHGHGTLLGRDGASAARAWLARQGEDDAQGGPVGTYIRASQRALRRRRVQLVSVLSVIVALALVASVVAVVAGVQRSDAVTQSRLAQSESRQAQSEDLAAEATSLLPTDAPLAMLLSLQADKRAPTLQAQSALIQTIQQPLHDLLTSFGPAISVAFSPDGRTLAFGDDGGIELRNAATGRQIATLTIGSSTDAVAQLAFGPDGRTLVASDQNGHIEIWDLATRQRTATWTVFKDAGVYLNVVAFCRDGRTVAVDANGNHQITLWDMASRQQTGTLPENSPVSSLAFSPDGRTLAASAIDGRTGLLDIATGKQTATLTEATGPSNVAFSPDGRTVAVGDGTGEVGLWNVATGKRTASLAEGGPVVDVVFSPDGQVLAVGDDRIIAVGGEPVTLDDQQGGVGLWKVATGKRIGRLIEGNQVNSVAFSPDGRALLTADNPGNVDVWNAATGQRFADLTEAGPVTTALFAPHGQGVAIGSDNGQITLLRQDLTNFSPQFYSRLICGEVRENLTQAEWAQYAPGQPHQKTCP